MHAQSTSKEKKYTILEIIYLDSTLTTSIVGGTLNYIGNQIYAYLVLSKMLVSSKKFSCSFFSWTMVLV